MKRTHHWPLLMLLAAALFLYIATLDTGLMPRELEGGDLITHQYAQVQARPGNAPGYPLYTMGGWLWFHGLRGLIRLLGTPLPNPMPILSSYSIPWALLSLALLYAVVIRLTRAPNARPHDRPQDKPQGDRLLAVLITAFYAVTYFFWYYANTTEQYGSAIAQTLAIVYVYLLWSDAQESGKSPNRPITRSSAPPGLRLLFLLAFLCGVSLAHMVTVAFIVPGVVILVLVERPDLLRRPLAVLGSVAAAALPLASYAYVYIRGAAHPEWWGNGTWQSGQEWFWAFVSTAQGRDELSWGLDPARGFWEGVGFPELIWQELSVLLIILGLAGIWFLGRRMAFLLYTTLLIYFAFVWVDRFGNWYQVILPAYPLLLLGLVGLRRKWPGSGESNAGGAARTPILSPHHLLTLLLLVAIVWRIDASWPAANSRVRLEDTALDRAALMLDQPLPAGAGLFAPVNDALALTYLTEIWGIRPDVAVVSREEVAQRLDADQPVLAEAGIVPLLLAELGSRADGVTLSAHSPDWVRLGRAEVNPPPLDTVLEQSIGEGITLVGYSVTPGPDGGPVSTALAVPTLDLILVWRIDPTGQTTGQTTALPHDWSISVRPTAGGAFLPDSAAQAQGDTGAILQQDRPGPVAGLMPFSHLPPGLPVADAYRLPRPPEADGIMVILYRAVDGGFENLAELRLGLP